MPMRRQFRGSKYWIGDDGTVESRGQRPTILRTYPHYRTGHPRVGLYLGGKHCWFAVHVLVAEVFIGPRPPGLLIRHLDGVCTNNAAVNLAYGTYSENALDWLYGAEAEAHIAQASQIENYGVGEDWLPM